MTTRNFRVNNGLEVGDIVISASANTITGGATAAPSADGQFANKKYVDDQDAAIASELAAEIYNLNIIKKNFQDSSHNVTRFLVMQRELINIDKNSSQILTTLVFNVRSIPAALYKCLGGFATNQVNLTKLESFSVKNTFDQVNFYIDIEGHIENPSLQKALEELGFHTQKLDILGVYEAHPFRFKNK